MKIWKLLKAKRKTEIYRGVFNLFGGTANKKWDKLGTYLTDSEIKTLVGDAGGVSPSVGE